MSKELGFMGHEVLMMEVNKYRMRGDRKYVTDWGPILKKLNAEKSRRDAFFSSEKERRSKLSTEEQEVEDRAIAFFKAPGYSSKMEEIAKALEKVCYAPTNWVHDYEVSGDKVLQTLDDIRQELQGGLEWIEREAGPSSVKRAKVTHNY